MAPGRDSGSRGFHNPTFSALANAERRAVLRALIEEAPLPENTLARSLAASEPGTEPDDDRIGTIRTMLAHKHLPTLRDAGLVSWDRERETVDTTDHPALTDPRFERILRIDAAGIDQVLGVLSHEIRRIALTELWVGPRAKTRTEIAGDVRERLEQEGAFGSDTREEIAISLHHSHLPKLSELGFITYSGENGRVTYADHPLLEEVFTIIYEPEEQLLDKFEGFLSELHDTYPRPGANRAFQGSWPHMWRRPYYD